MHADTNWTRCARRVGAAIVIAVTAGALGTACSTLGVTRASAEPPTADVAGFTRVATSAHYIVVVNVLPAEEMFTHAEYEREHPTVGELVIDGHPTPRPPSSRHTEAHIYSKATGLPLTSPRPTITLIDHTTGRVVDVDATLMQDVVIGKPDLHFGSNVVIRSGHDFTLVIKIASEEVSLDGRLP